MPFFVSIKNNNKLLWKGALTKEVAILEDGTCHHLTHPNEEEDLYHLKKTKKVDRVETHIPFFRLSNKEFVFKETNTKDVDLVPVHKIDKILGNDFKLEIIGLS